MSKPRIKPSDNGPYLVSDLEDLVDSRGEPIEHSAQMALCRCGGSGNKPFCDGTHAKIGFNSAKLDGRVEDKRDNYRGGNITIHDNRGICAHAGFCTDRLATVFKLNQEPWIDPEGATADEIMAAVKRCPSGALSYSVGDTEDRDANRGPMLQVTKNGPYRVVGGPDLPDTGRGQGASTEHFTLCRCGGSKNKPFCDGTHWHIKFTDERN